MVTLSNLDNCARRSRVIWWACNARNRQQTYDYIGEAEARGQWQECPAGITATEKAVVPGRGYRKWRAASPGCECSWCTVRNANSTSAACASCPGRRVQKELAMLQTRVEQGELKAAEKIGAAAARILGRHHGHRYFAWELREGSFITSSIR